MPTKLSSEQARRFFEANSCVPDLGTEVRSGTTGGAYRATLQDTQSGTIDTKILRGSVKEWRIF